ncbi:hypothetical protein [Hyphomicrobium sp. CS1GBMeth3]|uniref:hypothetical protein n=1 Tax=Hyphomicrobium sp. CS1GBMeth3 TaxID=1892845 RepID=UPI000A86DAC5|nr:hypothetical protein [Hyphomicrobium sp. CS1GBMeth3]
MSRFGLGMTSRYGPARLIFLDQYFSTVTAASWNTGAINLGQARGRSLVAVGLSAASGTSTPTVNSITIGGVAATLIETAAIATQYRTWLYVAEVPAESGAIAVTMAGNVDQCFVAAVYRLNNLASLTPFHTNNAGVTSGVASLSLNVPARGIALAAGIGRISGAYYAIAAGDEGMAAETGRTVSVNNSGSNFLWTGLIERDEDHIVTAGSATQRMMTAASWA